jgi:hypothetical protein
MDSDAWRGMTQIVFEEEKRSHPAHNSRLPRAVTLMPRHLAGIPYLITRILLPQSLSIQFFLAGLESLAQQNGPMQLGRAAMHAKPKRRKFARAS